MTDTVVEHLFSLSGKTALVSGGGRGIGKEIAKLFRSAGANVAIIERDESAMRDAVTEIGGNTLGLHGDIVDEARVKQCVVEVMARYGSLDVLVNNAALVRRVAALEMSMASWREVMAVNLDAAFHLSCEAARVMRPGSAIVNIASIMGLSGGGVYPISSYHASKGAIVNLTRGLAVEWAPKGIRVNAVAPTWVKTEFTRELLSKPETAEMLLDLMPLRSFADTMDVAAAVLYLASPAAKMVTGHTLPVDGGYLAR